jgi:hypothetical protein
VFSIRALRARIIIVVGINLARSTEYQYSGAKLWSVANVVSTSLSTSFSIANPASVKPLMKVASFLR